MDTIKWGGPLTGDQMKRLREIGISESTLVNFNDTDPLLSFSGSKFKFSECSFNTDYDYHLPEGHLAYTIIENGWLEKQNVHIWYGDTDIAPKDWDGGDVLMTNGVHLGYGLHWGSNDEYSIIAYISNNITKEWCMNMANREGDSSISAGSISDKVIMQKMSKVEAREFANKLAGKDNRMLAYEILSKLGLIETESALQKLITRIETNLSEPSSKLDWEIAEILGEIPSHKILETGWDYEWYRRPGVTSLFRAKDSECREVDMWQPKRRTSSLDAVLETIPEGFYWQVNKTEGNYCEGMIWGPNDSDLTFIGESSNPSMALCIAVLKYLETMNNFELVTIPVEEYRLLVEADELLSALYAAGVDGWEGYEHAQEIAENGSDRTL